MEKQLLSISEYCRSIGMSRTQFYYHKDKGIFDNALVKKPGWKYPKVDPDAADQALKNIRYSKGGAATKQKFKGDASIETPAPCTEAEVASYLDETIGYLSTLDIQELQRRNELEKLLLAQIKRRKESGELIDAEQVQYRAFEAGRSIRDAVQAIPDRTAPLLAAESEPFQIKQILNQEIYHVLENLAETIRIKP